MAPGDDKGPKALSRIRFELVDEAGVDTILVGDSLGMVVLGYQDTLAVTLEDMIHHGRAVARAAKRAMVIIDLPFMTYQISREQAMANAGRVIQETGAQAVKLEGGEEIAEAVRGITGAGVPVLGHLGLTPQSVGQMGGFKVQGKDLETARKLVRDALILEEAGAFGVVLECVPWAVAKIITEKALHSHHRHRSRQVLRRPGAGLPRCDGALYRAPAQVL